jgi:hypothetical protein
MIFVDIDGVLLDFYGTAKKFGIELKIDEFGSWKWGEPPYPAPEEFYAKAEPQPWFKDLMYEMPVNATFITKDHVKIKQEFIKKLDFDFPISKRYICAPDKACNCIRPIDLLIDDCAAECEAWRNKGGIAYHFNLASDDPFKNFIQWWEV